MNLILVLIRWLVGFFGSSESVSGLALGRILVKTGAIRFRHDSNIANYFGDGTSIYLLLAELIGLIDRRPAFVAIPSPSRCYSRVNPYRQRNYLVATARLFPNFSPPTPYIPG
jgi:hypothetical protein